LMQRRQVVRLGLSHTVISWPRDRISERIVSLIKDPRAWNQTHRRPKTSTTRSNAAAASTLAGSSGLGPARASRLPRGRKANGVGKALLFSARGQLALGIRHVGRFRELREIGARFGPRLAALERIGLASPSALAGRRLRPRPFGETARDVRRCFLFNAHFCQHS